MKNNNIILRLLGALLFILMLLIVFFGIYILSNKSNDIINFEKNNNQSISTEITCQDYLLPKESCSYVYYSYTNNEEIQDSKHYKTEMLIGYSHDFLQIKSVFNDSSEFDTLVHFHNDRATILGISETNIHENMIDNFKYNLSNNIYIDNSEKVVLSLPLDTNQVWQSSENSVSEITNTDILVSLPIGDFSAVEVTTNYNDGRFIKDYFVKNLGYVKSIVSDTSGIITTIYLKEINDETITTKTKLQTYDAYSDTKHVIELDNHIQTNPVYIEILEEMLKYKETSLSTQLISNDIQIQSAYINREKDLAVIDFSDDFLKTDNYSVRAEYGITESIAVTVGNFYKVSNIKLTYDNGKELDSTIDLSDPINIEL